MIDRPPPPPPDSRYTVRDPEIETLLRGIGQRIGGELPAGWGFALFLYSYGPNGASFYIANGEREGVIKMLKEFLARQTM